MRVLILDIGVVVGFNLKVDVKNFVVIGYFSYVVVDYDYLIVIGDCFKIDWKNSVFIGYESFNC